MNLPQLADVIGGHVIRLFTFRWELRAAFFRLPTRNP